MVLCVLYCVLEHSSFLRDEIALMWILFLMSALIHSTTYYANWFYQLTGTTSARVLRKFPCTYCSIWIFQLLPEKWPLLLGEITEGRSKEKNMILRRKWKVFNEEFPKLESRWVKYGARFFVANSNYYFRQRNASRRKFDKKLIPFLRCSMHACMRLHANPSSEFPKVCHKIGMTLQLLSGFLSVI